MKKISVLRIFKWVGIVLGVAAVVAGAVGFAAAQQSRIPDSLDMSSSAMQNMPGMDMSGTNTSGMDVGTPITKLTVPESDAPIKRFTLTAQPARIDLGSGKLVDAYTYNGTVPGPELRVQQGDRVEVTLINKLPVSTTIHWHGISVPNAEDGVAGVTQDAVKPGESYTYRFVAQDVGTYWYHSHQETSIQLPLGLYGAIIVEPKNPPEHFDRDYTVFLHEWGAGLHKGLAGLTSCHATCPETLTVNDRVDRVFFPASPGETVRLRIANSGNDGHAPVLVGAPFKVIALDGHDLNGPTDLRDTALPVGPAQRYDLSFVMPTTGTVALIDADDRADPAGQHPTAVFGNPSAAVAYPAHPAVFDFTTYGAPAADPITLNSHFNQRLNMSMGEQPGFFNGIFSMVFLINGQSYPRIPSIEVNPGDLVFIHMTGGGMFPIPHAMHLHGHVFTILAHNGKPLSGSPVHLDTVVIQSGESYDVAFRADNPGLWMLHCHIVEHDANGMDMMVVYPNISTPYRISSVSGNNPF
jgi:FtsP/CotA-like multicopper oxidase with cupredoxin domain